MSNFTLTIANKSNSTQDWMVRDDNDYVICPGRFTTAYIQINNDYTFHFSVTTDGGFAYTALRYSMATAEWSLETVTPNEWELTREGDFITLSCLLEDVDDTIDRPAFSVDGKMAKIGERQGKTKYPAYQLYKDNTETIYCSSYKVKNHAEGSDWISDCLEAHKGTSCSGKPWISHQQSGVIWP